MAASIAIGYMLSRGLAKPGTRDPFWENAQNEARERDFGDKRDRLHSRRSG